MHVLILFVVGIVVMMQIFIIIMLKVENKVVLCDNCNHIHDGLICGECGCVND